MLKNVYEYQGKRETQEGKVNQFDKIWILGYNPTDSELGFLSKHFRINTRKAKNMSKIEHSHIFSRSPLSFIYIDYYMSGAKAVKNNGFFYMGKNFLITLVPRKTKVYEQVFKELSASGSLDPVDVLGNILQETVETNYDVLESIEDEIEQLETAIIDQNHVETKLHRIIEIKNELIEMSKVFWQSIRLLFNLKKGIFLPVDLNEQQKELFGEIYDTFSHQLEMVSTQKEALTDSISIAQTTASNKLAGLSKNINISIKRLTLITLILTGIGTLIAFPNTVATVFGIPYLPIDTGHWILIIFIFFVSLIIPAWLFLWYWNKVLKKDKEI